MGRGMLAYMAAGAVSGVAKGVVEGIRQDGLLKREEAFKRIDAGERFGLEELRQRGRAAEGDKDRELNRTGMLADAENQKARREYETKTLEVGAERDRKTDAHQAKLLEAKEKGKSGNIADLLNQADKYATARSTIFDELKGENVIDSDKYSTFYKEHIRSYGTPEMKKFLETEAPKIREASGTQDNPLPLPKDRGGLQVNGWYKTPRGVRQFMGVGEGDKLSWDMPRGAPDSKPKEGDKFRHKDGRVLVYRGGEYVPEKSGKPLAGVPEDKKEEELHLQPNYTGTGGSEEEAIAELKTPRETPESRTFTPKKARAQLAAVEQKRRELRAKPDDELLALIREDLAKGQALNDVLIMWADKLGDGNKSSRLVRQAWQAARQESGERG